MRHRSCCTTTDTQPHERTCSVPAVREEVGKQIVELRDDGSWPSIDEHLRSTATALQIAWPDWCPTTAPPGVEALHAVLDEAGVLIDRIHRKVERYAHDPTDPGDPYVVLDGFELPAALALAAAAKQLEREAAWFDDMARHGFNDYRILADVASFVEDTALWFGVLSNTQVATW